MLEALKQKAKALKKNIITLYYAYQHPDLKKLPRIIILITVAYALSPIDLIPDFIPILGYLDDLIILPALITLSIKLIPEYIMVESRIKAENETPELKKHWFFAILFIAIWISLIAVLVLKVWKIAT